MSTEEYLEDDDGWDSGWGSGCVQETDDEVDHISVSYNPPPVVNQARCSLTSSGIIRARNNSVMTVHRTLNVPEYVATALLCHFSWDPNIAIQNYLDDPDTLNTTLGFSQDTAEHTTGSIDCSICWDESDTSTTLPCKHVFCDICIAEHLRIGINEGKSSEITCLSDKCSGLVPEFVAQKVLTPDNYTRYIAFAAKQFVESSNMKWCPRPGCTNAVSEPVSERNCSTGYCSCGYRFCFDCFTEAHSPATCEMMKNWLKKCSEDAATMSWLAENTKDCPKCNIAIQKNDGCFQMTCSHCKAQWCWLCQSDWKTHPEHFRCAMFNATKPSNQAEYLSDSQKTAERKSLSNYLGYYNMYKEHDANAKFEEKFRDTANKQMQALKDNGTFADVDFIPRAYAQLARMRGILKYTYVYAYYCEDVNARGVFELYQSQLECIAEKLTRELSRSIDNIDRMAVKSLTGVADTATTQLLADDFQ